MPTLDEIVEMVRPFGITHVGVAPADVMDDTRATLHERKAAGLHDTMEFTYRNPDRSTDPGRSVPEARSVVVAARPYLTDSDPPRPTDTPHGRVGRYAWRDHYAPLRAGLRVAARRLKASGHRAVVFADDNAIVDRAIAQRAGIGWFGKNANLLIPGAGSWFVLGSLVTTAEYEVAASTAADGCGTCTRCLADCPTGAIVAPGVIDAGECLSWVMQKPGTLPERFRVAVHDRMYGCDDCQDACPISVRLGPRHTTASDPADADGAWVDLIGLLESDDETIEQRHGHWYVAGREMRWLRRNALVALGNTGEPDDVRVRAVVERYGHGADEVLAEHARWAQRRLDERSTCAP